MKPCDSLRPQQHADDNKMEFGLDRTDEKGKVHIWKAVIEPDGTSARLIWTWGQENGSFQKRERLYTEGKQKRDATQQALLECKKMIKDKMRKGYVSTKCNECIIDDDEIVSTDIPHVMLAWNLEKYPEMYDKGAHIMPKLDGIFCLANLSNGELYSRQRVRITGLPHIEEAVKALGTNQWVVGELYRHGMEFQKITGLVRRSKHHLDDPEVSQIQFHIFDLVDASKPFYERYACLKKLIPKCLSGALRVVEAIYVPSLQLSHQSMHKKYTDHGYEGIMIHPDDGPGYQENKRTKWLLKYKTFQQEEYRCIRILPKKFGKHGDISAGSVLLVDAKGDEFSATPKMSEEEKKKLWVNRDDYAGQTATVQFFCLTDEKKVPRFPVLIGFRHKEDY